MNDNQKLMLIAIAAYLLLKKTGVRPRTGYRAQPVDNTKNMQNALWASLLGDVWDGLKGKAKTTAGRPIIGTNGYGQEVNSDGIPIDYGDDFAISYDPAEAEMYA